MRERAVEVEKSLPAAHRATASPLKAHKYPGQRHTDSAPIAANSCRDWPGATMVREHQRESFNSVGAKPPCATTDRSRSHAHWDQVAGDSLWRLVGRYQSNNPLCAAESHATKNPRTASLTWSPSRPGVRRERLRRGPACAQHLHGALDTQPPADPGAADRGWPAVGVVGTHGQALT